MYAETADEVEFHKQRLLAEGSVPGKQWFLPMLFQNNYLTSMWNRDHVWKKHNLKLKIGSLGFTKERDGTIWWEFGNPEWNKPCQFYNANGYDVHTWLEDEKGNIYDVFPRSFQDIAKWNECIGHFPGGLCTLGKSKEEMTKKYGLVYVEVVQCAQELEKIFNEKTMVPLSAIKAHLLQGFKFERDIATLAEMADGL